MFAEKDEQNIGNADKCESFDYRYCEVVKSDCTVVVQECRTPFGAKSFFDHEGLPYCETHFHARRGSLCVTCNKPVTGRCVTAMFRKYHPEHFVCTYCQRQLNKGTFKEQNNKPYCQQCFVRLFS